MNIRQKFKFFFAAAEEKIPPHQFELFLDESNFSQSAERITDRHLGACDNEGIQIFDTTTHQMRRINYPGVLSIAPYLDNRFLCLSAKELSICDATADEKSIPEPIFKWPEKNKFAACIALSPDKKLVAVIGYDIEAVPIEHSGVENSSLHVINIKQKKRIIHIDMNQYGCSDAAKYGVCFLGINRLLPFTKRGAILELGMINVRLSKKEVMQNGSDSPTINILSNPQGTYAIVRWGASNYNESATGFDSTWDFFMYSFKGSWPIEVPLRTRLVSNHKEKAQFLHGSTIMQCHSVIDQDTKKTKSMLAIYNPEKMPLQRSTVTSDDNNMPVNLYQHFSSGASYSPAHPADQFFIMPDQRVLLFVNDRENIPDHYLRQESAVQKGWKGRLAGVLNTVIEVSAIRDLIVDYSFESKPAPIYICKLPNHPALEKAAEKPIAKTAPRP